MKRAMLFFALTVFWLAFLFSAFTSLKAVSRSAMPNLYFDNSDKWYVRCVE